MVANGEDGGRRTTTPGNSYSEYALDPGERCLVDNRGWGVLRRRRRLLHRYKTRLTERASRMHHFGRVADSAPMVGASGGYALMYHQKLFVYTEGEGCHVFEAHKPQRAAWGPA